MKSTRAFSPEGLRLKKADYHGSATFTHASPDVAAKGVRSLNLEIPFDQALRLALAIQSCLQGLNRVNRNTAQGNAMGMLLSVKLENSAISVIEARVRPATRAPRAGSRRAQAKIAVAPIGV